MTFGSFPHVTVSPSPQPEHMTEEKLHALQKYARDFRRQHTTMLSMYGTIRTMKITTWALDT
jgi:hypothetical protein